MACFGDDMVANRNSLPKEWLRYLYSNGISRSVVSCSFRIARGLRVTVKVFLPFEPDVISMSHILKKFEHCLGFAICFKECILDVLNDTSDALTECYGITG